jgi:APA family basic amino acid/polyamine antiporter
VDDMNRKRAVIPNPERTLKRVLGLFSCTLLVVGNMIGVGIFTTPGRIATLLPSTGWVFLAWGLGALLAMSGALAYAELGAAYPEAGGNYVFLRESYGRLWGFLYGWSAAFITQSGTIAILAVGFTKYIGMTNPWHVQLTAIGLILVFGSLNYIGVKVGAGVVNAITFLKILAILGFAAAGVIFGKGNLANIQPVWTAGTGLAAGLAMALIPIMYTYSGWNATVYVGSEVVNPERIIPLSLLGGVALTASLYLLLNVIYAYAMPVSQMKGVIAIAKEASGSLFSPSAAQMVSFFIAFSVLGCLNATLLTAPRIPFAMAERGDFLASFADIHPKFRTPHRSILLQMVWASLLALWGGIDHKNFYRLLDDYVTVPSLLMNALTVSALFYLRRKKPDLHRPYKAWGYPVLPMIFIGVVLWMVFNEARGDFHAAISGIVMVALGVPFYWLFRKKTA